MDISLLDFFFPRMCCICKRHGNYICDDCKKLLKRNLPECYICRRLSPHYISHITCKRDASLDRVFVAWEYNHMSSSILKLYKYKNVQEVSRVLSKFFLDTILNSTFKTYLENTVLVPVPISNSRMSERGFNQMEYITLEIGRFLNLDVNSRLIHCKNSMKHQASKSKLERYSSNYNPFNISKEEKFSIGQYNSITLVDDVITTGNTLEKITKIIRIHYGMATVVNALCMFRGKPYYLPTSQSPLL